MKTLFEELFAYNHHYNQKLADVIALNQDKIGEKSIKLFSHMLNAHHIWNTRILKRQNLHNVWDIRPFHMLNDIDKRNLEQTMLILNNVELETVILYTNSRGQSFENKVRDILFHVINHSTYHRGQIATDFRQNGIEPLSTDYIFYKR